MAELSPIEAHERPIGRIFGDEYAFEIPPYQRPYAWEVEQAAELLSDLVEAMDQEGGGEVYFLGSIVLIKRPAAPEAKVVDGQQRLTTLTILLSVMRDLTGDVETKFERRTYVHQKASADKGTTDRYRLLLRDQDRAFFLKSVQAMDATVNLPSPQTLEGSQQRIAENAAFFRSELAKMDEARRNQLFAFIIQRCYLVVVAVPTQDDARRIFTVLNARGLDLTPTDILKAGLLDRAGSAKEKDLARRWEEIELELGRDRFVELFGQLRMIFEREKPRSALDIGFGRAVPAFNGDAESFVSDILEPVASASALVAQPAAFGKRYGAEAGRALRSLQRIDNKDWLPPILLTLWRKHEAVSEVAAFTAALERLAYFLFVVRADVNERIARFAAVMDEIDPRPGKGGSIGMALSNGEQVRFLQSLAGPLYRKSRVCKPVLQRLDEALSSGGAIYEDPTSIEHVLPQTVEDGTEWAAWFPDGTERDFWTHRLANLVLLTTRINIKASNWGFDRKKKAYFATKDGISPFPLTQSVLQADSQAWTADLLIARQEFLLDKLAAVWRLQGLATLNELSPGESWEAGESDAAAAGLDLPAYALVAEALLAYLAVNGGSEPVKVYGPLADQFGLSEVQRSTPRADNSTPLWNNRVQWARRSLKDRGYLAPKLGVWALNEAGMIAASAAKASKPPTTGA
jgi:hypothetical protein